MVRTGIQIREYLKLKKDRMLRSFFLLVAGGTYRHSLLVDLTNSFGRPYGVISILKSLRLVRNYEQSRSAFLLTRGRASYELSQPAFTFKGLMTNDVIGSVIFLAPHFPQVT